MPFPFACIPWKRTLKKPVKRYGRPLKKTREKIREAAYKRKDNNSYLLFVSLKKKATKKKQEDFTLKKNP